MKLDLRTQLLASGLPKPRSEFRFAPPRRFAFDFAFPAPFCVALEIEGGLFGRGKPCPLCGRKAVGAHTSIQRLLSDLEKYNLGARLGWLVVRATPEMVDDGRALAWVIEALKVRGWKPTEREGSTCRLPTAD